MTDIYLIRHCEAEGNLYRRVQGSYDGLPTALGRRQILALAERFRTVELHALYSSDLTRARETAGAIQLYHDLELKIDTRLREVHMGVWENEPWGNVGADFPEQLDYFSHTPQLWSVEGSESFESLSVRIRQALLDIAAENEGKTVAVVSHGMAIRTLICGITGLCAEAAGHGDNTAVALLHADNGVFTAEYFNDNSHLDENTSTFARQSWWRERSSRGDRHNLRLVPLDPERDRELYIRCYAAAWETVHGTLFGFDGAGYWESAKYHMAEDPRCVMKAYSGEDFAGLADLSLSRGRREGMGWISLCYIEPELRGTNDSIQLIGHAVTLFREYGYDRMRLHTAETNLRAIRFYEKAGFVPVGEDSGVFGRLIEMEMKL